MGPLIITAIAAVAMICILLYFKRRKRPKRVKLEGGIATGVFQPMRLEADQVQQLLTGPLADHRVVIVGDVDTPRRRRKSELFRCLSDFPLPDELVVAIERHAVTPGLPVALLVTHQDRLPRASAMDPLEMLDEEVEGRFPLWVVDGFEDWETFETVAADEKKAEPSETRDQPPSPEDQGEA